MTPVPDVSKLNDNIVKIKNLLTELEAMTPSFPAISRNSKRALASIKMMELNICDLITLNLMDDLDL